MDAIQAFSQFVESCLVPGKAERFKELCATLKGRRKVLSGLYHEFESAVAPNALRPKDYDRLWNLPCFIFHQRLGFGVEFASVRAAYDKLSLDDGWLILLQDGAAGIHRPEAPRWDHEQLIAGAKSSVAS